MNKNTVNFQLRSRLSICRKVATPVILTSLFALTGCNSSTDDEQVFPEELIVEPLEDGTILVGLPTEKSKSLFTQEKVDSSEQYIRNYLIKQYNQPQEYDERVFEESIAVEAPMESDSSDGDTSTSTTNTIENNVDEADFIKAFSENNKDYLVTITQPDSNGFYAYDAASIEQYKSERTPAQLNLFNIDTQPSSTLLTTAELNEDAYHVSGIYAYQSSESTNASSDGSTNVESQLIAQTSLREAPTDWSNYSYWSYGRTGIESTQFSSDTLSSDWSIVFDGHLLDSRRIDNHMYIALRHYAEISGLEYVYGSEIDMAVTIANNNKIIEEINFSELIPNVTISQAETSDTSPVFSMENCQLPNDDDRFSSGSVVFNYIAQIDLDTGNIEKVQCILAEINQLYMNEKSLFVIDSHSWSDQTSRLHRFDLADLSYDTSLTLDGTLGWRSAEFRIKELDDGTVVAITSKPENDSQAWCCWFNNNWIHKLQLFQKDENQNYAKIAELPNENNPDNDDTPQSIGKAGEDIYGVRIDEDSVKVVTFQRTDPLYVFDISNRDDPKFTGELADSGFSAYLHSFDDLIVGVGFEATEWGETLGLKVELYKADAEAENGITSIDEHVFGSYANTPVSSDHHAFSYLNIDDETTRIAMPAHVSENYYYDNSSPYTGLMLFTLDKTNETLTYDGTVKSQDDNSWYSVWTDRSVIQHSDQGSVVHYVHQGEVISSAWLAPE